MEWVQLDVYGRESGQFTGEVDELEAHLKSLAPDTGRVSLEVARIAVHTAGSYRTEKLRTSVMTLHTPWGLYRWIPRPIDKKK